MKNNIFSQIYLTLNFIWKKRKKKIRCSIEEEKQKVALEGRKHSIGFGRLYRCYLPSSCTQLLQQALFVVDGQISEQDNASFQNELKTRNEEKEMDVLSDCTKQLTVSFKKPRNGRY